MFTTFVKENENIQKMIIDTHSHIYQEDFDSDINEVIARAKAAGVEKILLPNIDEESIHALLQISDQFPGYCYPMMGLHPTSVTLDWQQQLSAIKQEFAKREYIAVGEIGIDLYWDKSLKEEQKQAFEEQLRWSIEYNLPVVIHSRDANKECIECVENVGANKLRGVFHSFGGTIEEMNKILSLGNFLLGVNGVVTFKNSGLADVLKEGNLSNIIIETDAPYLSPVPYRGKRNEPAYTSFVVKKLSEVFDTTVNEVERITTENALKLFPL